MYLLLLNVKTTIALRIFFLPHQRKLVTGLFNKNKLRVFLLTSSSFNFNHNLTQLLYFPLSPQYFGDFYFTLH